MSFTVTMPQLGETVTEGTVLRWVKQPGDVVTEDDVLLEISTDKVDTEVPSPFAGTMLEILVAEGETVDVGTALAVIGEAGEVADPNSAGSPAVEPAVETTVVDSETPAPQPPPPSSDPAPAATPSVAQPPATQSVSTGPTQVLSPVVRRLAAEHGVDLGSVAGSGRDGRITRRDVEAFVASGATAAHAAPSVPATPGAEVRKAGLGRGINDLIAQGSAPPSGIVTPPPAPVQAAAPGLSESVEPIDRLRTRIAANMIHAKQTAAHVWTSMEVDFESVERVRQRHKAAFKEREGFSLTYLPFISRATVDALAAFPVVNSSFDLEAGNRTFHGDVHLGIGVDLDQHGLVVMTMRGADGLRLRGIAREVKRIANKARGGDIEPDDVAGSTFTITNPGPYGSFMSVPIINLPNVAILSTDGIKKRPVVISDEFGDDSIAIHHVGYLGLTWDHRAFDGSTAVLFLQRIRDNLENWDWEQELA